MKFTPLEIPDVILIEPKVSEDARGFFIEYYREDLFIQHGIRTKFVQDNHSRSFKGVVRGLHYQIEPKAQAKFMRVVRGSVFDVCVDIRPGSKTFGKSVAIELSANNRKMLYIPEGFAHGFCVLEDGTEFFYKVSNFYSPEDERGILWNDPALGINWPKLDIPYQLSKKDQANPTFKEVFGKLLRK